MKRRVLCVAGALVFGHAPALIAQPREPISLYVLDIRGTTLSLPTTDGWTLP